MGSREMPGCLNVSAPWAKSGMLSGGGLVSPFLLEADSAGLIVVICGRICSQLRYVHNRRGPAIEKDELFECCGELG